MKIPYKEQLKNQLWIDKRESIKLRDDFKCQKCRSDKLLEVHHIVYIPFLKAWEYNDEYLITLCKYCHDYEHKNIDHSVSELIKSMKLLGFLADDFLNLSKQYK